MDYARDVRFRFCPYCGKTLEQAAGLPYNFCPYCGQSLLGIIDKQNLEKRSDDSTRPLEDSNQFSEAKISDNIRQDYKKSQPSILQEPVCEKETETEPPAEEIKKEVKEEVKEKISEKAPAQVDKKPKVSQPPKKKAEKLFMPPENSQYYSIVLKSCFHKKNLGNRLEKIFVRDFFAIRLALENMPSVIVYKSKVALMNPVIKAFRMEHAAISVIAGDFNLYATISDKYNSLHKLPADIQNMLYNAPSRLWLGDKIYLAARAKMTTQTGVLVITDQALYFLDNPGNSDECRWLITPYYQTEKISYFEDEEGCGLIASQKSGPDDIYPAPEQQKFYITDSGQAQRALEFAQLALEAENFQQKLLVLCPKCNFRQNKKLTDKADYDYCPSCTSPNKMFLL